jgi:hypothetical protein
MARIDLTVATPGSAFTPTSRPSPRSDWHSARTRVRRRFRFRNPTLSGSSAGALERLLNSIVGDHSDTRLFFVEDDPDPAVMTLARQDVFRFAVELDRLGPDYSAIAIAELERSLMVRLLLAHRHNFSHLLHRAPARKDRRDRQCQCADGVQGVFGIGAWIAWPVCQAGAAPEGRGAAEAA